MKTTKLTFLLILGLTAVVMVLLFFLVSNPQMICWDEGGYLWQGYQVSQAIRSGNWQNFWQLTRNQFYYPFFQSWFLAFATLPFGYTADTARLVSLLLFLPTVALVWLIAYQLDPKNHLAALLPAGLVLTSPLILYYFSTAMKEGIGLLLTLYCLWLYILAREKNKWFLFLLTGMACLILIFTKYNYGVLVLAVIGFESLVRFSLKNTTLFLPVVVGLSWWLSPPGYLKWFWEILQNKFQINLNETTVLGHLLYYPLELAFGYLFSWPVLIFLLVGFVWALKDWRNYKIRLLAGLFLLNFILAERHMANNQARFIFTSVPAFFLVGSSGLIRLAPQARKIFSKKFYFRIIAPFLIFCVLILLKDFLLLPQTVRPTGSHQVESPIFYEQDFQNINRFDFSRSAWPKVPPPTGSEKIEDIFAFIFVKVDLSKKISLVGPINEFSPDLFNLYLGQARQRQGIIQKQSQYQEYFVVLTVQPGSRFDNKDYRLFTGRPAQLAGLAIESSSATPIEKKDFPYLGLSVSIYGN